MNKPAQTQPIRPPKILTADEKKAADEARKQREQAVKSGKIVRK